MVRDGYVHEAAVRVLADLPGPVAAAALAVRVGDWVEEIRALSAAEITRRLDRGDPEDIAVIIPILLVIQGRIDGNAEAVRALSGVAPRSEATLRELCGARDRSVRTWALTTLRDRDLLPNGELIQRAMREQDPVIAQWAARELAAPDGMLSDTIGRQLAGSARAAVRGYAVKHTTDRALDEDELVALLLDRSGAVQRTALWRWRQRFGDPAPIYRALLTPQAPPQRVAVALRGLDEINASDLPSMALPFLTHPSAQVRLAAVKAAGRRGEVGSLVALLTREKSWRVIATALRYLDRAAVSPGLLAALDATGTPLARRTALTGTRSPSPPA